MNKPHCYGAMTWILKYPKDELRDDIICDCDYKDNCMDLTLKNKDKDEENVKLKAKGNITDQFNVVRMIKDKEYILIHEFEDTYSIVDEIGNTVNLDKKYFEEIESEE